MVVSIWTNIGIFPGKKPIFAIQTMTNMKKSILLAAVAALLVPVCLVSSARSVLSTPTAPADTLVINTTELCKDVIGYDGPTPLVIKVVNGVVAKVEALPNTESPSYFERVIQGGLLKAVVGKKVSDAAKMQLDAVSGATYSSEAVIENLRAGLAEAARK
jgi:electron transport complex protein RnfG